MGIDEGNRAWWTLVGACSGLFLLMLDSTVVALALTSVRKDLGASAAELQWVMNGYLLTIAMLVVTAGRLGDMFGRKRAFVIGMALFAAGSVLSGAAQSPTMCAILAIRAPTPLSPATLPQRSSAPHPPSPFPPLKDQIRTGSNSPPIKMRI
jgi:MFS family permease